MTDPRDIFLRAKDDLTLTREERALMRANIESLMNAPVTVTLSVPSPFLFLLRPTQALAFVLILAIMGSGSVAWAAEGSLPGDTLYGVKLGVNERVERALALGESAKATVEVRHAEERLQEVELLAAKGTVDEAVVERVAEKVEQHVERVNDAALALAREGDETAADAVQTRIQAALATHAQIIRAQSEDVDREDERYLRVLALSVENAAEDAEDAKDENIERPVTDDAWAERLALSREESVRERMAGIAKALGDDSLAVETRETFAAEYAEMEGDVALALEYSAKGDYREAANAYEDLERRAYRTLVFLSSAKRIAEKVDKEVLVTVERIEEEPEIVAAEPVMDAAATMMMKAAPEAALMAEPAPEPRFREELRFKVRDRE